MRRLILPSLIGLMATCILIGLGVWQLQRLAWKEAALARIEARFGDVPVPLPEAPDQGRDIYQPVTVAGRFTGDEILVLTSQKFEGIGYRTIAVLETTDGRRVMVDRGFLPEDLRASPRPPRNVMVEGNLHWPDETDSFTPAPDLAAGIWFARDVPSLATALSTEPTLIVARAPTGDGIEPLPVNTSAIANDHFGYAMTWFSLAIACLGVTVGLLLRIRRRTA